MAFSGPFGLALDLAALPATTESDERLLFSESTTRFLLEVAPGRAAAVEAACAKAGVPCARVGRVTREPMLVARSRDGKRDVLRVSTEALRSAWRGALPVDGGHGE
jgi:phosphoribosylformylglycinamidine synthase